MRFSFVSFRVSMQVHVPLVLVLIQPAEHFWSVVIGAGNFVIERLKLFLRSNPIGDQLHQTVVLTAGHIHLYILLEI